MGSGSPSAEVESAALGDTASYMHSRLGTGLPEAAHVGPIVGNPLAAIQTDDVMTGPSANGFPFGGGSAGRGGGKGLRGFLVAAVNREQLENLFKHGDPSMVDGCWSVAHDSRPTI